MGQQAIPPRGIFILRTSLEMVMPIKDKPIIPQEWIWSEDLKPVGPFWYSPEIIICKYLSTLPTLRFRKSHQFMRRGWIAWAYIVLCKDVHLVNCLGLKALELILGDGGILDLHVNVLVFILALNLVTDDNSRNRIAIQDRPRDHGWRVCDVGNLDVFWLRRDN